MIALKFYRTRILFNRKCFRNWHASGYFFNCSVHNFASLTRSLGNLLRYKDLDRLKGETSTMSPLIDQSAAQCKTPIVATKFESAVWRQKDFLSTIFVTERTWSTVPFMIFCLIYCLCGQEMNCGSTVAKWIIADSESLITVSVGNARPHQLSQIFWRANPDEVNPRSNGFRHRTLCGSPIEF